MEATDSDDSTYSGAYSDEEATEVTSITKQENEDLLTQRQLDDMWEQLQKMQENKRKKEEYFNSPQEKPKNVQITQITPDLFNPSCSRASLAKIGGKQVIDYAASLQRYAPKIITIHETRKFWQMYKGKMDEKQLGILN